MPRKKEPAPPPCPRCGGNCSVKEPHQFCQGRGCNLDNAGKGMVWVECPRCHGSGLK